MSTRLVTKTFTPTSVSMLNADTGGTGTLSYDLTQATFETSVAVPIGWYKRYVYWGFSIPAEVMATAQSVKLEFTESDNATANQSMFYFRFCPVVPPEGGTILQSWTGGLDAGTSQDNEVVIESAEYPYLSDPGYVFCAMAWSQHAETSGTVQVLNPRFVIEYLVTEYTLTVESVNPDSGVAIEINPADNSATSNGETPFTRTYDSGTEVTAIAPWALTGKSFVNWTGDGTGPGNSDVVMMNGNKTITANYQSVTPPTPPAKKTDGEIEAHHSNGHSYIFGQHLVGDWASGKIYAMSQDYLDDAGAPIKRIRRAPHVATEARWIYHQFLQVLLEAGAQGGNALPGAGIGLPEYVMSDPNGQNMRVTISDEGNIEATPIDFGAPAELYFTDGVTGQIYSVHIVPDESGWDFQLTEVADAASPYTFIKMITSGSGLQTGWSVQDGVMVTMAPMHYHQPQIVLRWSDDGGHTWSNEHSRDSGAAGEYKTRVWWVRLGRARDRVYEISCTDPSVWRIIDAYLKTSSSGGAQDRYARSMAKVM